MKKSKKLLALALAALMIAGTTTGCGPSNPTSSGAASGTASKGGAKEIYFLNFKPEIADKYKTIAATYEKETGVKVKVVTAAANQYETTLQSELAKTDAPTIFQINGPVGYNKWKKYCSDMSKTEIYKDLKDKTLAVSDNGGIYGVPYAVEGFGIIYNDAIMKKYFALSNKAASISKTTDIKGYAMLKTVVEDMTKNKAALGITGVFSSTSLKSGEDWRWQTHLANLPLYYEFKDNTKYTNTVTAGMNAKEIEFKYNTNYKNVLDLYLNNSVIDKKLVGSKSVDDSMAEFALGKSAMVQNGNWGWSQIAKVPNNKVKSDDVKFLPIYTGVTGEEKQGICIGTENYFSINSKVSADKQKASADFLNWLFSSDAGKKYVTNDLGFIAPFTTFKDADLPSDPLAKEVSSWMTKATANEVTNPVWTFTAFPSQAFKNNFGAALLQYAQGKNTWDKVVSTVKDSWKSEEAKIVS